LRSDEGSASTLHSCLIKCWNLLPANSETPET
jgi:hypothetical protein